MPELRAEIGKVASQIGVKVAAIRFTKRLGKHVNESTVRSISVQRSSVNKVKIRQSKGWSVVVCSSQETWQAFTFRKENRCGSARIHIETS